MNVTIVIIAFMNPNRPWTIYGLVDPRTDDVRYVGVNFRGAARYREHLCRARKGCTRHVYCWIRQLMRQDMLPVYRILETGQGENTWQAREAYWIAQLRGKTKLCNLTNGGDGTPGRPIPAKQRALLSEQRKGKKYPPGRKSAMLGRKHSAAVRAKIAEASRGRRDRPETSIRRSEAAKRRGIPPEQQARMAMATAATRRTSEFREKARLLRSVRRLLCEQTGEIFLSLRQAAAAIGATKGALQFALRDRRPCKGFTFRILSASTTSKQKRVTTSPKAC
jgi:hypothetical protein